MAPATNDPTGQPQTLTYREAWNHTHKSTAHIQMHTYSHTDHRVMFLKKNIWQKMLINVACLSLVLTVKPNNTLRCLSCCASKAALLTASCCGNQTPLRLSPVAASFIQGICGQVNRFLFLQFFNRKIPYRLLIWCPPRHPSTLSSHTPTPPSSSIRLIMKAQQGYIVRNSFR